MAARRWVLGCFVALAAVVGACVGEAPSFVEGPADAGTVDGGPSSEASTDGGGSDAAAPPCQKPCDVATGQTRPHGIAVDGTHVYWTNRSVPGTVLRKRKDGGEAIETLGADQNAPVGVAVTPAYAFWLTTSPARVVRYSLSSKVTETAPANVDLPQQIVATAGRVFFTGEGRDVGAAGRGVRSVSDVLDDDRPLATDIDARALAVEGDGSVVYYGRFAPRGELRYVTRSGDVGRQPGLDESVVDWKHLYAIADGDTDVYWTSEDGVFRHEKTTFATAGVYATPLSAISDARGIVYDRARTRAYFVTASGALYETTAGGASQIGRADCEAGLLAQDETDLYWTCGQEGAVKRMTKP